MKSLKDYRVYNNITFLIPVLAGIYSGELVFTILAVLILIGSTFYHFCLVRRDRKIWPRVIDIVIASSCYIYLFYFATFRQEESVQLPLYIALASTILIFIIGKIFNSQKIHAVFHTSIAIAAAAVVLV